MRQVLACYRTEVIPFSVSAIARLTWSRARAPSAFIVFGALELSPRSTQVPQGCPHVRLIGPNRIQTGGSNHGNNSETDSQYFHPARSSSPGTRSSCGIASEWT
jgi:hypothetical protein